MVTGKNYDLTAITARIQALVQARRDNGLNSYYLSQLGNDLGNDRSRLEAATGKRLADFVQEEFDFKIASTGQHNTALYIYFGDKPVPPSKRPRIRKDLWDAFATPLRPGEKRHVNLTTFAFGDLEMVNAAAGNVHEVPARYIVGAGEQAIADALSDRIVQWLHERHLDPLEFAQMGTAKPIDRDQSPGSAREVKLQAATDRSELLSAYDILRLCMTEDQLLRMTIPIDAIDTLMEKKFRR